MLNLLDEVNFKEPAHEPTLEEAEQNLLFVGTHSTTGRLFVQFAEGEEAVAVEIKTPELRAKMLSLLIDGLGGTLDRLRGEEANQA